MNLAARLAKLEQALGDRRCPLCANRAAVGEPAEPWYDGTLSLARNTERCAGCGWRPVLRRVKENPDWFTRR